MLAGALFELTQRQADGYVTVIKSKHNAAGHSPLQADILITHRRVESFRIVSFQFVVKTSRVVYRTQPSDYYCWKAEVSEKERQSCLFT